MKLQLLKQNLDYDGVIKGTHLDKKTYERKFRMWDWVETKNLLAKKDEKALLLLDDPTIYFYAFFNDETGKRLTLTLYQDAIANCKHDFTDNNPNKYILFKASNQIGKSLLLGALAIYNVFDRDNVNVVIVSKSLPQSQFVLATIRHLLNNSVFADTWRFDCGEQANTTILTFQRKKGKVINRIICAPCGEGLLGYPVHYLFLDEADFYENGKTFFWKVAYPRVLKTKGQIILFSNPNTEISRNSSILWELWNGDLFKRKFTFNYLDAPWNTKEQYEIDKRNSPSHIFQSTHDGDFPIEGGAFFSHSEIRDMFNKDWTNTLPSSDKTIYVGVDLGKMNDQTIISIGKPKKPANKLDKYDDLDVKFLQEFPLKTPYDAIVNRLIEIKNHYKENYNVPVVIGFDATGQKTFGDLARRMGLSALPIDFSKKETNKTLLYNDFKLMAENRKMKIIYSRKCEKQLSELVFKLTEMKKLKKVEHSKESIHDDYPDSLAILIHIAVKPSRVPISIRKVKKADIFQKQESPKKSLREQVEESTIKRNMPMSYGDEFSMF